MNKFLIVSTLILMCARVNAAPTIPEVSDIKTLMLKGIDSDKEVVAYLNGELAEKIKSQSKAPADTKVKARVATIQKIRNGCKRLLVEFSEPTHLMLTNKGTKEPFVMWYQLNICRDGKPPEISKVGKSSEDSSEIN